MKTSTSLHSFSVDEQRSPLKLAGYIGFNLLNNMWPHHGVPDTLPVRPWIPPKADLPQTTSSPTRVLSDLFWDNLPWERITAELGQINICDIGCGSGGYYRRFLDTGKNHIASYVGLDKIAHPNWQAVPDKKGTVKFQTVDLNTTPEPIPVGTTLITSQSTLEHIEHDLQLLARIATYARGTTTPLLQIHLVPARACLPLYLFHGVRQYTPRTLTPAWRLFEPFSDGVLFSLGSPAQTKLHFTSITIPHLLGQPDQRQRRPGSYNRQLQNVIRESNARRPSFYVVVFLSHPRTSIADIFTSNSN